MHPTEAAQYYKLQLCGRSRRHDAHTHALGSYLCSGDAENVETPWALELQAKLREQTANTGNVYYESLKNFQP